MSKSYVSLTGRYQRQPEVQNLPTRKNVYTEFASILYNVPHSEVTAEMRDKVKRNLCYVAYGKAIPKEEE